MQVNKEDGNGVPAKRRKTTQKQASLGDFTRIEDLSNESSCLSYFMFMC
jgi:hypothetical protein